MACKYIRSSTGSIGAAVSFKRAMSAMHAADGIPGSPILHRVLPIKMPNCTIYFKLSKILRASMVKIGRRWKSAESLFTSEARAPPQQPKTCESRSLQR